MLGDASGDRDGWAHYCLTTRWGSGGRLVVGLAPASSSPASGLHVLRPARDTVPAAYLAALYNSTLYQEIAASLPPGQLRQEDLERIGLPHLGEHVGQMTALGTSLANTVLRLVRQHSPRFPALADALRADAALKGVPDDVWIGPDGPSNSWGKLPGLGWIRHIGRNRAGTTPLGDVSVVHDVLGLNVVVNTRGTARPAVTITLADPDNDSAARALACRLRAVAAAGGKVRDVADVVLPIDPARLVSAFEADRQALNREAVAYRRLREEVDTALTDAL